MTNWVFEADVHEDPIVELSDRVRHDAYAIDVQAVATAVLHDLAASWEAFTQGRAHGHAEAEYLARRHAR